MGIGRRFGLLGSVLGSILLAVLTVRAGGLAPPVSSVGLDSAARLGQNSLESSCTINVWGGGPFGGEVSWGDTAQVSFDLRVNNNSVRVIGKTITYSLNGTVVGSATTNADTLAALEFSIAGLALGTYPGAIVGTFAGDSEVAPCSVAADLTIQPRRPWKAIWTGPSTITAQPGDTGESFLSLFRADFSGLPATPLEYYWWSRGFHLGYSAVCAFFTPADPVHYVAGESCHQISVNLASSKSQPTIVGSLDGAFDNTAGDTGSAIDPVHNLLYASKTTRRQESSEISVIDGTSNQIIGTIQLQLGALSGRAHRLAIDPGKNRLYAIDGLESMLWTVDTIDRTVMSALQFDASQLSWDAAFAINPTTGLGYLSTTGNTPTIHVLDLEHPVPALATIAPSSAGCWSPALAVDSVTNLIFTACGDVIGADPADPTFNQLLLRLVSGGNGLAVSSRTHRVYFTMDVTPELQECCSFVLAFDGNPASSTFGEEVARVRVEDTVFVDGQVSAVAVNPITGIVYALGGGLVDGALIAFDGESLTPRSYTFLPSEKAAAAYPAIDGLWINPNTGTVYVMDADWSFATGPVIMRDRYPSAALANTSPGPVTVSTPEASLTFASVSSPGTTTIQQIDASAQPLEVPGQFSLSGALAYEISTTASITPPIQLCFNVSSIDDRNTFEHLSVLHGEDGTWVDRTASREFETRTICASVNSLSPFAIAGPTTTDPIAPISTSVISPNGAWTSENVSVSFNATDNSGGSGVTTITYSFSGAQTGSGLFPGASGSISVTAEGETNVAYFATDAAGNVEPAQSIAVRIDRTPPTVTLTSPMSTTYLLHQAVAAGYTCADSSSGVALCLGSVGNGGSLPTDTAGSRTFSVQARDAAGNATTTTTTYAVAYGVRPLYDEGKPVKSGSTIPIKLQLSDAAGANVSSPAVVASATAVVFVASTSASAPQDSGNANPDGNFRYDATLGSYIFNLSTKGLAAGQYQLRFTVTGDPTPHTVGFVVGK